MKKFEEFEQLISKILQPWMSPPIGPYGAHHSHLPYNDQFNSLFLFFHVRRIEQGDFWIPFPPFSPTHTAYKHDKQANIHFKTKIIKCVEKGEIGKK